METIEPKERERIEANWNDWIEDTSIAVPVNKFTWISGAEAEHLHLQNTVIEPLRKENDLLQQAHYEYERKRANSIILANNRDYEERISKLEAENKELREALKPIQVFAKAVLSNPQFGETVYAYNHIKITLTNLKSIDQLLTKNEGL